MNSLLDDIEQVVGTLRGDVINFWDQVDVKLLRVEVGVSDRQQLERNLRVGQVVGLLDGLLLEAVVVAMGVVVASELRPSKIINPSAAEPKPE